MIAEVAAMDIVGCTIQQRLCKEDELLPQFIAVSVARFFLYYTDFLCASNKYKDAQILTLKTQDLLKSVTFGGILINICIIEQDLSIQQLNTKKVTIRQQFTMEQTPVKQVMPDSCLKTPCNYPEKITITKIPLRKYNGPTTSFVHPPPIPFRLDRYVEESEKENTPSPAVKVHHRTRQRPKLIQDQHKKLKSKVVRKL